MSGLFGCIAREPQGELAGVVVERMGKSMRHLSRQRVESREVLPGVAIGRLHIGIFNADPQPVADADSNILLWLCGEFYHHEAERRRLVRAGLLDPRASDEEFALALYIEQGTAGLTRLEGIFAIAVWDARLGEVVLVNDRYGLYPHYWTHQNGMFVFAPELKGVLSVPGICQELDEVVVAQYVRLQQLMGERTWISGVEVVPPAAVMRYQMATDRLCCERYWSWAEVEQIDIGYKDAVNEGIHLFQRAMNAMAPPGQSTGLYLSGGLDGRMILGFSQGRANLQAMNYGQPGSRDVVYSAELSRRADTDHHWFPFRDGRWVEDYAPLHLRLVEGSHSWLHSHGVSTVEEARSLFDVGLSGFAGNTMMRGPHRITKELRQIDWRDDDAVARQLFNAFCYRFTWPGLTDIEAIALHPAGAHVFNELAYGSFVEEYQRLAYIGSRRAYHMYGLHKDRRSHIGMVVQLRAGIEVRCPFMDYQFASFMQSIPLEYRSNDARHRTVRRGMITRRMPRLATVPRDTDNHPPHTGLIRRNSAAAIERARQTLIRRTKLPLKDRPQLYADYEEYLRSDLRRWAECILFDQRTAERGLFNPAAVRALWDRHISGKQLWTVGKIAPLIEIERICRLLIDDQPSADV